MSKILVGVSGLAFMICGLIKAMQLTDVIETESIFDVGWFWIFAVLSSPFLLLVSGIVLMTCGAVMLSLFVGLDNADALFAQKDEDEEEYNGR